MSYTELEHGYQGLRQATQPQFYVGDDGNLVPIRSVSQMFYSEYDISIYNAIQNKYGLLIANMEDNTYCTETDSFGSQ